VLHDFWWVTSGHLSISDRKACKPMFAHRFLLIFSILHCFLQVKLVPFFFQWHICQILIFDLLLVWWHSAGIRPNEASKKSWLVSAAVSCFCYFCWCVLAKAKQSTKNNGAQLPLSICCHVCVIVMSVLFLSFNFLLIYSIQHGGNGSVMVLHPKDDFFSFFYRILQSDVLDV